MYACVCVCFAVVQVLAAARQEEFEKWKGHLVGLESALQAAQKEATNYRSVCMQAGQVKRDAACNHRSTVLNCGALKQH